jgi:hypothetical protein
MKCYKEGSQVTTLLSWLSIDDRGPSSIYIVSDSRITWGSADNRWDSGRKVFATQSADIFGYCGEVLFPSLLLGQLGDLIDRHLLWQDDSDAKTRHSIIVGYLKASFKRRHNAPNHDFTIMHCSRDASGLGSAFSCWRIDYDAKNNSWRDTAIDVSHDSKSRLLIALGSGGEFLNQEIKRWNDTSQGGTARSIFSAFCDALEAGGDPYTGGMPQIVALDRQAGGKVIGFATQNTRYIYGLPVEALTTLDNIDWVDGLFQRISSDTLNLLPGAQRHVRLAVPKKGGLAEFFRRTFK